MSEFNRRGHYRTNANGTTFWVQDHEVRREEYVLKYRNSEPFINDSRVIANYECPKCGQRVFFYQNEHGSKVFFDQLGHPWPKHGCFKESSRTASASVDRSIAIANRKARKRDMKAALKRRGQELKEKIHKREERRAVIEREEREREERRVAAKPKLKELNDHIFKLFKREKQLKREMKKLNLTKKQRKILDKNDMINPTYEEYKKIIHSMKEINQKIGKLRSL
jgi:predicted  nucleic acid-binding Zn-ribbon protein